MAQVPSAGAVGWFHTERQGSVISVTDASGHAAATLVQAAPVRADVTLYAVWPYFRFALSLRDVEAMAVRRDAS